MNVEQWNALFNIGQRVIYRPDSGRDFYSNTISTAFELDHYIMGKGAKVLLDGVSYPVSLERVRAV